MAVGSVPNGGRSCHLLAGDLFIELGLLNRRLQDLEGAHQVVVDGHDSAGVVELVAVIGRGEDRDELALRKELISILDYLVGTADEIKVVFPEELFYDIGTEGEGDTTIVLSPSYETLLGIGPQQVANETGVSYIAGADDLLDLLHLLKFRGQATVAAEDLVVDDARNGKAVEGIRKGLPQLDVVPALALIEEPIDTVDGGALVVAAEDEEVLGELDLEGQDEANGLKALLSTVDVIT